MLASKDRRVSRRREVFDQFGAVGRDVQFRHDPIPVNEGHFPKSFAIQNLRTLPHVQVFDGLY
jgi:hypothetical protein